MPPHAGYAESGNTNGARRVEHCERCLPPVVAARSRLKKSPAHRYCMRNVGGIGNRVGSITLLRYLH